MAQLALVQNAEPVAPARADHQLIAQMIGDAAHVLDVGCGDGALMRLLRRECGARVRGIERDAPHVRACVKAGLSVVQGDAARDLAAFPDDAFDVVIFSRSLTRLPDPRAALKEAGRIGKHVIVSFDNAGHWPKRLRLLLAGRTTGPGVSATVCFTIRDFAALARSAGLSIERASPLSHARPGAPFAQTLWRANWFAESAVVLLER
jgi:methionine biosynthesis protein MetW